MPPPSSDEIRAAFIEFWQSKGSHLQPSSSLIPHNDPTVLLTTAGMQQFVPYFLGKERSPYPRYVSVQKCFRTSRHRRGRRSQPPDVLRDAGQLLDRRLLQEGSHPLGARVRDAHDGPRAGAHLDHHPRNRRRGRTRSGSRPASRRTASSASATRTTGGVRPARPARAVRTASSTTPRARASRAASQVTPRAAIAAVSSSGTWSSCNTTRTSTASARLLPQPERRHGHGHGALRGRRDPGTRVDLRHRPVPARHPRRRVHRGRHVRQQSRHATTPCASWPTTRGQ